MAPSPIRQHDEKEKRNIVLMVLVFLLFFSSSGFSQNLYVCENYFRFWICWTRQGAYSRQVDINVVLGYFSGGVV